MSKPKATRKRQRPRHRGAAARANADLTAHIASLGLRSVAQYRRWCHDHGFTAALNKGWQERRAEREVLAREAAAAAATDDVLAHVRALGLDGIDQYQAWCRAHDLSESLHKGERPRRKELDLARDEASRAALGRRRELTRRPAEAIESVFAALASAPAPGDDRPDRHEHPAGAGVAPPAQPAWLDAVAAQVRALAEGPAVRDAFRRLLLAAERRRADLFDVDTPAVSRFATGPANTWIGGLVTLAERHEDWLRPLETWRPAGRNPRRHFGSLARHLLARYDLPAFFDTAFFDTAFFDTGTGAAQVDWFVHVGAGGNLRTAPGLPVTLTKRMAHEALRAPAACTLPEALRWGQIVGQDGDPALVDAVVATRLGAGFDDEAFWATVIHWLTRHPMLDAEWVTPIVDYIAERRFGADAPEPHFSMKSRSVDKLLRLVDEWRLRRRRDGRVPSDRWAPCGIGEYRETEPDAETGRDLTWSVRELTTTEQLVAEGKAMSHCVRSYVHSCRSGRKAVFSVQIADAEGHTERLMTVAVRPQGRRIIEARGRFNALPSGRIVHKSKKHLDDRYRRYLRRSRAVMRRWEEREGLVRARTL